MPQKPENEKYTLEPIISSSSGHIIDLMNLNHHAKVILTLSEDEQPFHYDTYSLEIHPPVPLLEICTSCLPQAMPRCLDMPIRLAGDSTYHIPEEWADLVSLLEQIIAMEHANNPNWSEYHTYITVDSSYQKKESQQRRGGLHVDGFQGERIAKKTKITRNYVLTTNGGTIFYPQRFVVANPAKYNVFHGFSMQTPGWARDGGIAAAENVVHFMNAYSVHESGLASHDGERLFVRVTYDIKEFDRYGNTHNSMIDYNWDMVARDTQDRVQSPDISHVERSPHFAVNTHKSLELPDNFMIGISGKPGAGKNWVALALLQELRFRGIHATKTSIAKEVHLESREIIRLCQNKTSLQSIKDEYQLHHNQADKLLELWQGDVGAEHPEWGFHRRNESVRRGLEMISLIRREQDETYWLGRMLSKVPTGQVPVFSDLAFPNEADHILRQQGSLLRVEVDPLWLENTQGRNPGYKYSDAAMSHPVVVALDNYAHFDAKVNAASFDATSFVKNTFGRDVVLI